MREIKFRGKVFNIWVYGHYLPWHSVKDENGKDVYAQIFVDDGRHSEQNIVGANTVGQYTGLRDKNGKEIYEGDIVRTFYNEERDYDGIKYNQETSFVEKIVYDKERAAFVLQIEVYGIPMYRSIMVGDKVRNVELVGLEVIGNIYDNPELLKGDKE